MLLAHLIRNKCKSLFKAIIRSSQIIKFHSMEKKEETTSPVPILAPAPEAPKEERKIEVTVPIPQLPIPAKSFANRSRIRHLMENPTEHIGKIVYVAGWARTLRFTKKIAFVELSDGSGPLGIQVVIDKDVTGYADLEKLRAGCSLGFKGKVVKSPGSKQPIEMQVKKEADHLIKIYGDCPPEQYPLAKKEHTMEVLYIISQSYPIVLERNRSLETKDSTDWRCC